MCVDSDYSAIQQFSALLPGKILFWEELKPFTKLFHLIVP